MSSSRSLPFGLKASPAVNEPGHGMGSTLASAAHEVALQVQLALYWLTQPDADRPPSSAPSCPWEEDNWQDAQRWASPWQQRP